MSTVAASFRAALSPASSRLQLILLLESAAAGFVAAAATTIAGILGRWPILTSVAASIGLAAITIVVLFVLSGKRRHDLSFVARLIEKRAPNSRNIIVTAAELVEERHNLRPEINSLVLSRAIQFASALDPRALFPSRRATVALSVSLATWLAALLLLIAAPSLNGALRGGTDGAAEIGSVRFTVIPPEYTGRPTRDLENPDRIDALAGSRVRVRANGSASLMTIETLSGSVAMTREGADVFAAELLVETDGYIALEPKNAGGVAGERRLTGLSVTPDHPPVARVTAPGRDLFVPDSRRVVDLSVEATDDIELESVKVKYTTVSGAGEQFTFTDGEVPIALTKADAKSWKGQGKWTLDSLHLAPGDIVVYRAVVTDKRPGAVPSESDTFIIEITGPGALAAGGFSLDEEQDRYAISQQMVILKSERLLARRTGMSAEAFSDASHEIAAEQRKVRAEFVFMMGGELAEEVAADLAGVGDLDERTHAAVDDDAVSGRLATNGRLDLVRALRSMSRAASSLTGGDVTQALVDEKEALVFLQRAFARTRYILRTLTERERLDQARRLTGVLVGAASDRKPTPESESDSSVIRLRAVLSRVATLAATAQLAAPASGELARLAQSVLQVDASSQGLQRVSSLLISTGSSIASGDNPEARRLLDQAATALASAIRGALVSAPKEKTSAAASSINGTLVDALRRAGRARR